MKSFVTIRRLLAIVMIAGLAMAPLARPAMAEAPSHGAMQAAMMQAGLAGADQIAAAPSGEDLAAGMTAPDLMAAAEMSSEMPCCPAQAPVPTGCDKCVAMIGCMSSGFVAMPVVLLQPGFVMPGNALPRHSDARADGIGDSPPEHPPRNLV
ncbi:MAG TPA: hypothetical protein VGC77_00075 [Rhodopseudomonas sp.]|uniref:hypothetical protein n=1 Tax=Rhodopseudomonas sp. TaxID=1078 RepID=UPI002EDAF853